MYNRLKTAVDSDEVARLREQIESPKLPSTNATLICVRDEVWTRSLRQTDEVRA